MRNIKNSAEGPFTEQTIACNLCYRTKCVCIYEWMWRMCVYYCSSPTSMVLVKLFTVISFLVLSQVLCDPLWYHAQRILPNLIMTTNSDPDDAKFIHLANPAMVWGSVWDLITCPQFCDGSWSHVNEANLQGQRQRPTAQSSEQTKPMYLYQLNFI